MQFELTPTNLNDFRKRFGTFHDAVIHNVEYAIFSKKKTQAVTVTIGTHDWENKSTDNWVNLTFHVEDIQSFILEKTKEYYLGIVFEISLEFIEDEIYIDFYPTAHKPRTIEEYKRGQRGFGSDLFIIGKRGFWSLSPYEERK